MIHLPGGAATAAMQVAQERIRAQMARPDGYLTLEQGTLEQGAIARVDVRLLPSRAPRDCSGCGAPGQIGDCEYCGGAR